MPSEDSDDAEFVVFGTPLSAEEATSRRHDFQKQEVKDASANKSLPVWKQEAVDSEGRARFHGAFTGGFSAGYYNSVGSAEGWAPAAFRSSRESRAAARKQEVGDFLDEDERAEAGKAAVRVAPGLDTFGAAASTAARDAAEAEAAARFQEALPGLLPAELLAPVAESLGIQLLQKMGWRQGRGLGAVITTGRGRGGSRWGRSAGTAPDPVPVFAPPTKEDTHGLGFDPFRGAEEFRRAKAAAQAPQQRPRAAAQRPRGTAFGVGVDDTDELYGMVDDYVSHEPNMRRSTLHTQIAGSDDDDDNLPLLIGGRQQGRLEGPAAPKQLTRKPANRHSGLALPGFTRAAEPLAVPSWPAHPVPADFGGRHIFPPAAALRDGDRAAAEGRRRLDLAAKLAEYTAKAREVAAADPGQRSAPLTESAFGGTEGLHAPPPPQGRQRQQHPAVPPRPPGSGAPSAGAAGPPDPTQQRFAGEGRGAPLAAGLINAAAVLQTSFVKGTVQDMSFAEMPGLRRPQGLSQPSRDKPVIAAASAAPAPAATQPTSAAAVATPAADGKPKRSVEEWRPAPLLCKRLNVADPYKGRPAPKETAAVLPWTLADLGQSRHQSDGYQPLPLPPPPSAAQDEQQQQQQQQQAQLPPPPSRDSQQQQSAASLPPWQQHRQLDHQQQHHQQDLPGQAPPIGSQPDAGQEADAFLAGLSLPLPPPPAPTAGNGIPGAAAAAQGPPPSDDAADLGQPAPKVPLAPARPMDLFKAIFEASDSSDSESDAEQHAEAPSQPPPPPQPQQLQPQPPAGTSETNQFTRIAASVGQNGAASQQEDRAATSEAEPLLGPQMGQSESQTLNPGGLQPEKTSIIQAALKRLRRKEKKKKKRRKEEKAKKRKHAADSDSESGSDAGAGSDSDSGSAERRHKKKRQKHKSSRKS